MQKSNRRILIYGYGNPGRQDDALGILISSEIEKWVAQNKFINVDVDQNYQLNIEDAEKISHYDLVIFADASINAEHPYSFDIIRPDLKTDFTMHSVQPSFVVGLCEQIFRHCPETYLLQIRGYNWELIEKISPGAKKNLNASLNFLKTRIKAELELG